MPAAEYHHFAFRAIEEKIASFEWSYEQLGELRQRCQEALDAGHVLPSSKQPVTFLGDEVLSIKSHIGNILFVTRSLFDTFASLLHFLYGPESKVYKSFKTVRNDARTGTLDDAIFREYVLRKLGWFDTLRGFRDLVAHGSRLDLGMHRASGGELKLVLANHLVLADLLANTREGIAEFISFADEHFGARLSEGGARAVLE
jgi:hypothetical protein